MASMNKVLLAGNLTRDPEIRTVSTGASVCQFGLAMNRKFRNAAGEPQEEVCFVDITVWGKQAEACSRYLQKGRLVMLEGRLKLDQWEDESTKQKRSRLTVVAEKVQFLPSGQGGAASGTGNSEPAALDSDLPF